jgi:hypothetical protein
VRGTYDRPQHGINPISLDFEAARKDIDPAKFAEERNVGRALPICRQQACEAIHSPS